MAKDVTSLLICLLMLMKLSNGQGLSTDMEQCQLDSCTVRGEINAERRSLREDIRDQRRALREETGQLIKDGRRSLRDEIGQLLKDGRRSLGEEIRQLIREERITSNNTLVKCSSSPCENGGSCTDTINGYTCFCPPPFYGPTCHHMDACVRNPCENYGSCIDTGNGFICNCFRAYTGPTCHNMFPRDCGEIKKSDPSAASGVYTLQLDEKNTVKEAFCDMDTDGGGWLVFQKRFNGEVDFFRDWHDYSFGFGNLNEEFWWGNTYLFALTMWPTIYQLRVDLTDFDDTAVYAVYSSFSLAPSFSDYTLNLGSFSGTVQGDALSFSRGHVFSTRDRDNDGLPGSNCVDIYHGAWWWDGCGPHASLNGQYYHNATDKKNGIWWYPWKQFSSMKLIEMKVRPVSF